LDDAVLRRLPRRILVDLPDAAERSEILRILLRDEEVEGEKEALIAELSKITDLWSGSDLKNLCIAAAMAALREQVLPSIADGAAPHIDAPTGMVLKLDHFKSAIQKGDATPSLTDKTELMRQLRDWDRQYGSKSGTRAKTKFGF
jgi:SpoVK/Ycf46/Vps4 family AAA+-type ATPase